MIASQLQVPSAKYGIAGNVPVVRGEWKSRRQSRTADNASPTQSTQFKTVNSTNLEPADSLIRGGEIGGDGTSFGPGSSQRGAPNSTMRATVNSPRSEPNVSATALGS